MPKIKVFISFDYDNDNDLRTLLVGQAKNVDTPFDIADFSVKDDFAGNLKEEVRQRIKKVDQVIVICGVHTATAPGVNAEIAMAQEEKIPYFLLSGRSDKAHKKPQNAKSTDKVYNWTWYNLKALIAGIR